MHLVWKHKYRMEKDGVDLISDGIITIQNSLAEDQYKLSSNLTIKDPRQGGSYCCVLEGTSVYCVTVISPPPPLVNTSILECRHDVERGVYRTDIDCEVNMTTARARKNAILTVAINNSVSRTASSQSKDYWNSSYGNTTFYHKRETIAVENVYPGSLVQCRLQDSVIHRTISGSSIIFRPDSWPSCQTPSAPSDSRLSTMDLVIIMTLAVAPQVLVIAAIYFVVRFCTRFSAIRTKIPCLFCARSNDSTNHNQTRRRSESSGGNFEIEQPSCSSSPNYCQDSVSESGNETVELNEVESDDHLVDGISMTPNSSRRCDPSDVEEIPARDADSDQQDLRDMLTPSSTANFSGARDCTPKKAESDMEEKIQSRISLHCMAGCNTQISDTDPWNAVRTNSTFLGKNLRINADLLHHLYEREFITAGDYDVLMSPPHGRPSGRFDKLLEDILPRRPAKDFFIFCEILRTVGQRHVAARLESSIGISQESRAEVQDTGPPVQRRQCRGDSTIRSISSQTSFKKYKREDILYDKDCASDFIDSGGYGDVFKAQIQPGNKTVAVKVFNSRSKRRFSTHNIGALDKEVQILSRLQNHPNIVKLLGYCDHSESCMLVMECIQGPNLNHLLSENIEARIQPLIEQWRHRLDVSSQVAEGVRYIHSQIPPVIHMDLSPHNVLVEIKKSEFLCKITDFGLSKMNSVSSQSSCYDDSGSSRRPSGRTAFIAPERYSPSFSVSKYPEKAKKIDVFSFGMIMCQVHEMRVPYERERPNVIFNALIEGKRPGIDESNSETLRYRELLRRCWSHDPQHRPQMEGMKRTKSRFSL